MNTGQPKVIFDCNVLFQAFLTRQGPAKDCIRLVEARRIRLVTSLHVLAEAREVLTRAFVVERAPHVTPQAVDFFLNQLAYAADLWRKVPHVIQYDRDRDDEPYLDLAIAAATDYLVTRDRDLLILPTDPSPAGKQLRQLTQNRLQILPPEAFLSVFLKPGAES